jgi:hypothetical protein
MTDEETVKTLKKMNDVSRLIFAWIGLIMFFMGSIYPKVFLYMYQFLSK